MKFEVKPAAFNDYYVYLGNRIVAIPNNDCLMKIFRVSKKYQTMLNFYLGANNPEKAKMILIKFEILRDVSNLVWNFF